MSFNIALHSISFAYRDSARPDAGTPILRDCSLTFGSQDRIGLIGHTGSGKTTLLSILMGLLRPDAGQVIFEGRAVQTEKGFRPVRRAVGFLFQNADDQLFWPTVLEDVAFGPLNLGMAGDEARAAAERALARVGLAGFGERLTHKLSGGEKRLAALAGVLAMEPKALVLDEPTTGLDPDARERLAKLLLEIDLPRLVVSHDWDFLDRTTTSVVKLAGGCLEPAEREVLHRHVHAHPAGDVDHKHE